MSAAINPACDACKGACCESLVLPIPSNVDNDMVHWLEIRGRREVETIRFECTCPHLEAGRCAIHHLRPRVCRIYPVGGPQCIAAIRSRRGDDAPRLIKLAKQYQTRQG